MHYILCKQYCVTSIKYLRDLPTVALINCVNTSAARFQSKGENPQKMSPSHNMLTDNDVLLLFCVVSSASLRLKQSGLSRFFLNYLLGISPAERRGARCSLNDISPRLGSKRYQRAAYFRLMGFRNCPNCVLPARYRARLDESIERNRASQNTHNPL